MIFNDISKINEFLVCSEDSSLLDAASSGASNAVPIVLGIIANIVAFVAFVAFLNGIVSWLGFLVGLDDIDFEWIFSKIFIPLAWAMGVPKDDCDIIAKVVATKTIINEFVAYERLGEYIKNDQISVSKGFLSLAIPQRCCSLSFSSSHAGSQCRHSHIRHLWFRQSQFPGHPHWFTERHGAQATWHYHLCSLPCIHCGQHRVLHIGQFCR